VYIDTETAKKAAPTEDNKYPFEWCYPSPGGYPTSMCDAGETNLRSLMAAIIVNQPNKKRKIRMLYGLIQEDGDKEAPRKGDATIIASDSAVKGWFRQTERFAKRFVYAEYHQDSDSESSEPSGHPDGWEWLDYESFLPAPPRDQYVDLPEDTDDEFSTRAAPRNFPRTEVVFQARIPEVQRRILRQLRLLDILGNRALHLFPNIEFAEIDASSISWLQGHRWASETLGSEPKGPFMAMLDYIARMRIQRLRLSLSPPPPRSFPPTPGWRDPSDSPAPAAQAPTGTSETAAQAPAATSETAAEAPTGTSETAA
jgi:hypothetical protein